VFVVPIPSPPPKKKKNILVGREKKIIVILKTKDKRGKKFKINF